jgi:GGDEF domain-containing protein
MAHALRAALPHAAATARLGGDEFGALLISQSGMIDEAATLATLRAALERQAGVHGHKLSASLGAASSPPEPSVQEAGRVADQRSGIDKMVRRASRS